MHARNRQDSGHRSGRQAKQQGDGLRVGRKTVLALGVTPHVAQHRVIFVEAINARGAKRARTRREVADLDQLGDYVANDLIAALA